MLEAIFSMFLYSFRATFFTHFCLRFVIKKEVNSYEARKREFFFKQLYLYYFHKRYEFIKV